MGRLDLLSADERARLFGIPVGRDALARCYIFEPVDLALIERRREDRNRLCFAVQLAIMRHPGLTLAQMLAQPGADLAPLVEFIAEQLELSASGFDGYAAREQTMTDHARDVATGLGLRPATRADLTLMIDAASGAAWATDKESMRSCGAALTRRGPFLARRDCRSPCRDTSLGTSSGASRRAPGSWFAAGGVRLCGSTASAAFWRSAWRSRH